MFKQAHANVIRDEHAQAGRQHDALYDGIGHRRIRPPADNGTRSPGSPWALAPWPTLELTKAIQDGLDRYLPGRGNREVIATAGDSPAARLEAVMHDCVLPALGDVRDALVGEGYDVELEQKPLRVVLRTRGFNGAEIVYEVEGGIYQEPVFSLAATLPGQGGRYYPRIDIVSSGARRRASLEHCSRAAMRRDALHALRNQILY